IWPFRQTIKTRTNSKGVDEAVITQPVLPTYQDIDNILMFIIFSIFGYFLLTFIQKKSIS
ncbi:MAG: hypothetical protein ACR2L5_00505, partial [Candidatus Actinomarinaceae bacterium]